MEKSLAGTPCNSSTADTAKELDEPKNDEFSEAERVAFEGSVWRRLDKWIIPMCTIICLLSFVVRFGFRFAALTAQAVEDLQDRGNIGNARVAGMQTSLNISNYEVRWNGPLGSPLFRLIAVQYSVALTVTYV